MANVDSIETPSGKGAAGENFPVGSFLLPRALRPHLAAFYAFARAADDIADNPALAPVDKIARLDRMAKALEGAQGGDSAPEKARRMRESLAVTDVSPRHCLDLLDAFRQDAVKSRYEDWHDLLDYCNRSAAPVGRYLIDLHGEDRALWPPADALCNALQVLNHLQDCGEDYRAMDRVYIGCTVGGCGQPGPAPGTGPAVTWGQRPASRGRAAGRTHEKPASVHGNRRHPRNCPQTRRAARPPRPAGRAGKTGPGGLHGQHGRGNLARDDASRLKEKGRWVSPPP